MNSQAIAWAAGTAIFFSMIAPGNAARAQDADAQAADTPASAEITGGDIVVTAQRRSERARDVPISLTVISGADLRTTGVEQLRDVQIVTPGLRTDRNGASFQPAIRGVTALDGNPGNDANVSLYVDGVYRPNPAANAIDLPDVDRIEVLKGPQGTLFGRNATGGAIRIQTRRPTYDLTGDLSAGYGSFNDFVARGFVSLPIVANKVAASVSGLYEKSDGYLRDAVTGERFGGVDIKLVRAKLLLDPTENFSLLLSGEYMDRADGSGSGQAFAGNSVARGLPGVIFPAQPWVVAHNSLTGTEQNVPGVHTKSFILSAEAKLDLGAVTLNSLTSYSHYDVYATSESDYTNINRSLFYSTTFQRTFNQELNLTSNSTGAFRWVIGAFYYDDTSRYDPLAIISPASTFNIYGKQDTKAYAGFGEVTLAVDDKLSLIGGLRYSHEERTLSGTFSTGTFPRLTSRSFNSVTPRASIRYALTPTTNAYATYSKGFKSGGFTVSSLAVAGFAPEKLDAYEIGIKSAPSSAFSINAAGFYYRYKDQQVQAAVTLPSGATVGSTINAARSNIYGLELDAVARPSSELKFSGTFAWLHARYASFPTAFVQVPRKVGGVVCLCGNVGTVVDATGNQLVRAPDITASASVDYVKDIGAGQVGASATLYMSDSFFFTPDNRVKQSAYETLNMRLFWRPLGNSLEFAVWGKNLTNSVVYQGASILPDADGVLFAPPRSFGAEARYHF